MRRILITGAVLFAAAACADQPVAPRAAPGRPTLSTGARATRIPNTVKYSDAGAKPANARAGAASLTVSALLDKAGTTELTVISGRYDQPGVEAGTLENVQVKAFPGDSLDPVVDNFRNVNAARWVYTYADLGRGVPLQVRASISGIDPSRTDVVTVSDQVRLRPDLAVASMNVPPETTVGVSTPITAVIRERNGDVGARADCVLYRDGTEVDRASNIWVDAGGTVSCAFRVTFTINGVQFLTVAVENVSPGDYDTSNNSMWRGLSVVPPESFRGGISIEDATWNDLTFDSTIYVYPDGRRYETSVRNTTIGRNQRVFLAGTLERNLTFPVDRVRVRHSSGGVTTLETVLENGTPDESGCLFVEYTAGRLGWLEVCVPGYGGGFTRLYWLRTAGDAVYHSAQYSAMWDGNGTPIIEPTYHVVTEALTEARAPEVWNGSVKVELVVEDDGVTYSSAGTVTLDPYETFADWGSGCESADLGYVFISRCYASRMSQVGWLGSAPLYGTI
jgi:hypothetical protein